MKGWRAMAAAAVLVVPAGGGAQRPASGLEVVRAALHQYDGGPPLPSSYVFQAGDTIFLTFRIAGFKTSEIDEEDRLHLLYTITAADPGGVPIKEPVEGAVTATLTEQDKKKGWLPLVRYDALLPPTGPPGEYAVRIAVEDKLSGAKAEARVRFTMSGRSVEPSDTLTVRNFAFYRSETSIEPLRRPVYRPGDSVWARFDIVGYQFAGKNRFSIAYGIRVLRANGSLLFEQPVAAAEERESFYPERHIQGGFSLNLTSDLTAGDYSIVVTVTDKTGGQTYEIKQVFTVA